MANSYAVIERIRLERAFDAVMLPSPLGGAWLPAPSMTMNCDESEPFIYVLNRLQHYKEVTGCFY
jgi:hypothetical protein